MRIGLVNWEKIVRRLQRGSGRHITATKHELDVLGAVKSLEAKIQAVELMSNRKDQPEEYRYLLIASAESLRHALRVIQLVVCQHNHKVWDPETGRPTRCILCGYVFPNKERQMG